MREQVRAFYSFCYLKGRRLYASRKDSITIRKLVSLKRRCPSLKVLLSLGGWGGCRNCSVVFSTDEGRVAFARSVRELMDYFDADGIDLDWEFPTLGGYPGHPFSTADKENFTQLLNGIMFWELRLDRPVNGLLSVIYNGWH